MIAPPSAGRHSAQVYRASFPLHLAILLFVTILDGCDLAIGAWDLARLTSNPIGVDVIAVAARAASHRMSDHERAQRYGCATYLLIMGYWSSVLIASAVGLWGGIDLAWVGWDMSLLEQVHLKYGSQMVSTLMDVIAFLYGVMFGTFGMPAALSLGSLSVFGSSVAASSLVLAGGAKDKKSALPFASPAFVVFLYIGWFVIYMFGQRQLIRHSESERGLASTRSSCKQTEETGQQLSGTPPSAPHANRPALGEYSLVGVSTVACGAGACAARLSPSLSREEQQLSDSARREPGATLDGITSVAASTPTISSESASSVTSGSSARPTAEAFRAMFPLQLAFACATCAFDGS